MRLWAYRFSPQPEADGEHREHFDCADRCRRQGTGDLAPHLQAGLCCALPKFHVGTWTGDRIRRVWMGRPRDYSREGKGDWAAPAEHADEAGCPGAWYRTRFVESLFRYTRRRDHQGGRIDNPLLTRCTDELVLEAIRLLEAYEAEFDNEVARVMRRKN